MKRLFFKQGEKTFKYTVIDYQIIIKGEFRFYIFTDIFDGIERTLREDMYQGEENISEENISEEEVSRYARRN